MLADELRPIFLFDGLTDAQVADLAAAGEKVAFDANEELFKEGDPAAFWWVLLDGKIQIVRRAGQVRARRDDGDGEPRAVGRRLPGVGRRELPGDRPRRGRRARVQGAGHRARPARGRVDALRRAHDQGLLPDSAEHGHALARSARS